MKILFIEPPKQPWFIMGNYLPPPFALLCLAAYLDAHHNDVEIQVMDCQAEEAEWEDVEKRIKTYQPDIVAPSTVSTCNANLTIRTAQLAKLVDRTITTLAGGLHFTALAQETLENYPEIDVIVCGEGEVTLLELIQAFEAEKPLSKVKGISFRQNGKIVHTPNRPLIENLDTLPYPGYYFVKEHMPKYRFPAGKDLPYALVEGSRGCDHTCTFCSQCIYWGKRRRKTPIRVVDEFEYLYQEFGSRFLWFTDDNMTLDEWMIQFCDELKERGINEDLMWFVQVRADDIIKGKDILPKMREVGAQWIMTGLERHDTETLHKYRKGIAPSMGKEVMEILKENDILAQSTAIIGDRHDSQETLEAFREWISDTDPDIAIFMTLTPYPGTPLFQKARENGWLEDPNWANFDMIHAIMSTDHLTRQQVQKELFRCYREFYGWRRRIKGVFSKNKVKRNYYRHMMWKGFLGAINALFRL